MVSATDRNGRKSRFSRLEPLVGEVIANLYGQRVFCDQPNGSQRPLISVF
jgi:hypothetical protein